MNLEELNVVVNSWPEGTRGWHMDASAIAQLDHLGKEIGYGALEQFAHWLYLIQCHGVAQEVAAMKRERFRALGWPLPSRFEEVAASLTATDTLPPPPPAAPTS